MRLALVATVLLVAGSFGAAYAAGAFGGVPDAPSGLTGAPPPPDATELAAIQQLVLRAASAMGDPNPTEGVLVPTTRRLAELVDLDSVEPDTPVYFVLVHGEFSDYGARIPRGGKPPTGTLLTLTIDPRTNEPFDTGLVGAMPDVNAMGELKPLPLPAGAA